jgi:enediyne biosynthesis protein E4
VGVRSNRDGMGAKVKVGNQWTYATTSGSYLSASAGLLHFGLGVEKEVTVEIVWPNGKKQVLENAAVDRLVTIKEVE